MRTRDMQSYHNKMSEKMTHINEGEVRMRMSGTTNWKHRPAGPGLPGRGLGQDGIRSLGKALPLILPFLLILVFARVSSAEPWNSLLHNSNITNSTKWSGWGLPGTKYGEITCETCHVFRASNIKGVKSTIRTPDGTAWPNGYSTVAVNFSITTVSPVDPDALFSFGWDTQTRTSSTRVCEVCHSITKFHRYDARWQTSGGWAHNNATDCTTSCHPHNSGFDVAGGACDSCHGNPPTTPTAGATTGYVSPATGAMSIWVTGAHYLHNATRQITCEGCHAGANMLSQSGGNAAIEMGFKIDNSTYPGFAGSSNSGTFKGYSPMGSYSWSATYGGTSITNVGTYAEANRCENIYCHGGTLANSGGANRTPQWTTAPGTQAACGTCHGTTAASSGTQGSHQLHAGQQASGRLELSCTSCHPSVTDGSHVNGSTQWQLLSSDARIGSGTYRGTAWGTSGQLAPSAGYGTCGNIYCHSDVQNATGSAGPTAYGSPSWGSTGSVGCTASSCHDATSPAISTGRHTKHVTNYSYTNCANYCHNGAGTGTANHANYKIEVVLPSPYGGTYSQQGWNTPGNGFGTCVSTYCHSQGTSTTSPLAPNVVANWGSGMPGDCTGCHNNDQASNKWMTSASHRTHVDMVQGYDCSICHSRTASNSRTISSIGHHVDQNIDIAFLADWTTGGGGYNGAASPTEQTNGSPYGRCDNIYCHSDVQPTNGLGGPTTYGAPSWGSTGSVWIWGSNGSAQNGNCSTRCHNTAWSSQGLNSGSHRVHAWLTYNAYECTTCHSNAGQWTTSHVKKKIDLALNVAYGGSYSQSSWKTPGNGFGKCSGVSCHGAGSPGWGSAASSPCGSCHKANRDLAGRHNSHYSTVGNSPDRAPINKSVSAAYIYGCGTCHNNQPHAKGQVSANQRANVSFDGSVAGGGSYTAGGLAGSDNGYNWTSGSCAGTYCHSSGTGAAPNVTNFNWAWKTSSLNCAGCHGGYVGQTPVMASGKHTKHVSDYSTSCSRCHNVTTTNGIAIADRSRHVNRERNVDFDSFVNTAATWATSTSTCASTYCHSAGSSSNAPYPAPNVAANWTTILPSDCTGCHNNDFASGKWMSSGSHTKHIDTAGVDIDGVDCSNCHAATVTTSRTITSFSNHTNRQINIAFKGWNSPGTFNGQTTPTWSTPGAPYGTCTNIYCHSQVQGANGITAPSYGSAVWNSSGSVTLWTSQAGGSCVNNCHNTKWSANGIDTGSHRKHAWVTFNNYDCTYCHMNAGAWNTAHVNQWIEVKVTGSYGGSYSQTEKSAPRNGFGSCSGVYCHSTGAPIWGSSGTAACGSCHPANSAIAGRHNTHWATAGHAVDRGASNDSWGVTYQFRCGVCHDTTNHAKGAVSGTRTAEVYMNQTVAGAGSWYTPGTAWSTTDPSTNYKWTGGTCASSCHTNGNGGAPNKAVTWGDAAGSLGCSGCHGGYAGMTTVMATAKHSKHVSNYGHSCARCHRLTTTNGTTISDTAKHVNMTKNVAFDGWSSLGTWSTTSQKCDNLYCHSRGTSLGPNFAAPNIPADWRSGMDGTCTGCHNHNVASGRWMTTGSHNSHVGNSQYGCKYCHVMTSGDSWNISSVANHTNRLLNISFDPLVATGTSPGYNGSASPVLKTPGTAYGSCQDVYCHSGIQNASGSTTPKPAYSTPSWGSANTVYCGTCHMGSALNGAGWITSGSHKKHVMPAPDNGYVCGTCHRGAGDGTANHANRVINVWMTLSMGGSYSQQTAPGDGFGTCSGVYCHGTGVPTWGGTVACSACHATGSSLAGRHNSHYSTVGSAPDRGAANNSTSTAYIYRCGVCHSNINHATGPVNSNRQAEVVFDSNIAKGGSYTEGGLAGTDGTFKWTSGSCAGTYCHSNGGSGAPNVTNFNWAWKTSSISCAGCHGGYKGQSPEISSTKHPKHVGSYGKSCAECHNLTTTNGTTIADKRVHVNGTKNVAFSAGGSYATSTQTCNNTYCHAGGASVAIGGTPFSSISWSASINTCNACHGKEPGNDGSGRPWYTSRGNAQNAGLKANSHMAHTAECGLCHSATAWASTNGLGGRITSFASHANKVYNVVQGGSVTFNYAYGSYGGNCSNISCHGGVTRRWGTGPGGCLACHSGNLGKTKGYIGTIRNISADFALASRHVMGGAVIKWDCIVCHLEGGQNGSPTTSHGPNGDNTGRIHLRNVDTVDLNAGWSINNKAWGTQDYRTMDNFCLTCHDSDGAKAVSVNASNNGLNWNDSSRALTPFNTSDTAGNKIVGSTERAGSPRIRVVDVKTQFFAGTGGSGTGYNGNPSQHAVLGPRYSTKNVRWNTSNGIGWGTIRLRGMGTVLRSVGETAQLTCADCHVLDSGGGAHGGSGMYNLNGVGATGIWSNLCWNCHTFQVYSEAATAPGASRWNHLGNDGGRVDSETVYGGATTTSDVGGCLHCHAVWNGVSTFTRQQSYGGIHGGWVTYTAVGSGIQSYRFFPGAHMKVNPYGGTTGGWASGGGATTSSCYFWTAAEGFQNCVTHAGSSTTTEGVYNNYNRPLKY